MRFISILTLVLTLMSCSSKDKMERPADILSQDTMVLLLADLHMWNAANQHRDSRRMKYRSLIYEDQMNILDSLGVERKEFEQSLEYYLKYPEEVSALHDEAMNLLSTRLAELNPSSDTAQTTRPKPVTRPKSVREGLFKTK